MNTRLLLLTTILVADLSLAAVPPETLPLAIEQQVAAQQALARQESEAGATLRKWYESALDVVKKDATGKGDLNSVLAADQERERLDRDLTPEEKTKLTPVIRKVRDQYDQARVQMANQQKAKLAASLRAYITTLEALEKTFTQNSDIQKALASRDERTKAEEQLKVLTPTAVPAPVTTAQATPPKPASAAVGIVKPTLREALVNWVWTWTGAKKETDVFLTFLPNGTVSHRGMKGTWKIEGEDKVKLIENHGRTLILKFDENRKMYECILGAPDLHGHRVEKQP